MEWCEEAIADGTVKRKYFMRIGKHLQEIKLIVTNFYVAL